MIHSRFRRILTVGAAVAVSAGLTLSTAGGVAGALTPLDALTSLSSNLSSSALPGSASDNYSGNFIRGENVRVIDGDTLEVGHGAERTSVRLIGIDTPETVHPNREEEPFGAEATTLVQQLIRNSDGGDVLLELDESQGNRDFYGRLLAYAWTIDPATGEPDTLINLALLEAGYATEYTFDADYRHQAQFQAAEAAARDAGLGIWG